MADQLLLGVARNRVTERGYGIAQTPGDEQERLSGNFSIDPLTGFACAPVDLSFEDALTWPSDSSLFAVSSFLMPNGSWYSGVCHRSDDPFVFWSTSSLAAGSGFFVGFVSYGAGSAWSLWWGNLQLLIDGGRASLQLGAVELAAEQLWTPEVYEHTYAQPHYLYVYQVASRLCVRTLGARPTGFLAPVGTGFPGGPVAVSGEGYLAWQIAPERHDQLVELTHAAIGLPEGSTQEPSGAMQHWLPAGATTEFELLDETGASWPGSPDPPYSAFGYRAQALLPAYTGPNGYITRVRVQFPQLKASDGLTPTDLLTLPNVRVLSVEDRRATDPASCELAFQVVGTPAALSPYVRANERVSWRPDGTQRADAYVSRPALNLPAATYETIAFGCELGWKRFEHAPWGGDGSYAGKLLGEAYRDAALRAGLDAGDIVIDTGGYRLPAEDADGRPLFDFRPDETVAQVLLYLRDNFGAGDLLYFAPDGKFHAAAEPSTPSGVTFYWAGADLDVEAITRGTETRPWVLGDSWRESFDETGFANDVWVVGQDATGVPLVAVATDWDSIRDDSAANYFGEFRKMVIIDAGLTSQPLVNWVAAAVLARVRTFRLRASFRAIYVPSLGEGAIVAIEDRGNWRLSAMTTRWDGNGPQGIAAYEAEYLG